MAAEPNGTATLQVADHDPILVSLGNGDLVDADHPRSRVASAAELLAHVLLVELLDGMPIEVEFLGHFLDGGLTTASAHEEGKSLGIQRIVGQPLQPLGFHGATPGTPDPANLEEEVDAFVATREIADPPWPLVVIRVMDFSTGPAGCFFRQRLRVISTAWESPKMPRSLGIGTKPGNRYRS